MVTLILEPKMKCMLALMIEEREKLGFSQKYSLGTSWASTNDKLNHIALLSGFEPTLHWRLFLPLRHRRGVGMGEGEGRGRGKGKQP